MNLKSVIIIAVAGYVLLFSSCRKNIEADFPSYKEVPTMNAVLVADSSFELHFANTGQINDNPLPVTENAQIQIFINNTFEQTLDYKGNGIYTANTIIAPLSSYRCEYITTDNQVVKAENIVPESTEIINLKYFKNGWVNADGIASPAIEFIIPNDTSEIRYYHVWVDMFYGSSYENVSSFQYDGYDPITYFNTKNIKETTILKRIEFEPHSYSLIGDNAYAYILELRCVSEDYYKYIESLELYEQGRFPEFDVSTAEPSNLYSNVENGFGIFAAYASTVSDTLY